jgi:hypothetical protein
MDERTTTRPAAAIPAGYDGPHACGPLDLALALDLLNLVFRSSGSAPAPSIGWEYSFVYHPGNLENLRVICHQGRVVTLVAIYPTDVQTPRGTLRVGGVCGVATHPDHRRRGLAAAAMADAHATMRSAGRHVGLLGTGIADYYRALGWERAGSLHTFTLDRANLRLLPRAPDLDVTDDWRPHLAELCALHNARLPAAIRTPETFAVLAERRAPQILVARRQGRAVAYVALRDAVAREHAGAFAEVAALLHCAHARLEATATGAGSRRPGTPVELSVVAPAESEGEGSLAGPLRRLGIPHTLGYLGMVKLLDIPGVLAALGLDELDLQPAGEQWRLRAGPHTRLLDERDLVRLLFGPERPLRSRHWLQAGEGSGSLSRPDAGSAMSDLEVAMGNLGTLLPVPFFQWPLDRV